jgi:hypothetical protein
MHKIASLTHTNVRISKPFPPSMLQEDRKNAADLPAPPPNRATL